jgi:D-alanyl-D-alanine carboxypeptidase/D-alanyl-D-alanine-endopeptidase (penicillin-binding protein 4)
MEIQYTPLNKWPLLVTFFVAMMGFAACVTHKKSQATTSHSVVYISSPSATQTQTPLDSLLNNPALKGAQVGICIAPADSGKPLFEYQSDKYFIPASNMKLFTCYAAMQYLGDSLTTFLYVDKGDGTIAIEPNGDPSFLVPDFAQQPAFQFLQLQKNILISTNNWKDASLGAGWAWDDYTEDYMAERSAMPIYGNVVTFSYNKVIPTYFDSLVSNPYQIQSRFYSLKRGIGDNLFEKIPATKEITDLQVPFHAHQKGLLEQLLSDNFSLNRLPNVQSIHSQPTDSLLKIMMHRSDNFFAEQSLLMVSNTLLGEMNDRKIIQHLLATDFAGLPQKPKWVDGSGLSRYNLVTPADLVAVLQQMRQRFGMNRLSAILPSANAGTLQGYYRPFAGNLLAKTGTLSNQVSISGYVTTAAGQPIVFSVLVNNHMSSATPVRRAVESYLTTFIRSH